MTSLELVRVHFLRKLGIYGLFQACKKVNLALLPHQNTCCGRLACYILHASPLVLHGDKAGILLPLDVCVNARMAMSGIMGIKEQSIPSDISQL